MPEFRKGDRVSYKPVGGTFSIHPCPPNYSSKHTSHPSPGRESHTNQSVGVIREVSTVPTNLTGRNVEASEEEPRYEVRVIMGSMEHEVTWMLTT